MRVSAPDVQGLFVWWLGDDVARVWRVASRYMHRAEEAARALRRSRRRKPASPQHASSSTHERGVEIVEVWTDATFELWVDGARSSQRDNPYGFIPFVIYPNLREPKQFWGVSDIPADARAGARAEPRAVAALDDPGAVAATRSPCWRT